MRLILILGLLAIALAPRFAASAQNEPVTVGALAGMCLRDAGPSLPCQVYLNASDAAHTVYGSMFVGYYCRPFVDRDVAEDILEMAGTFLAWAGNTSAFDERAAPVGIALAFGSRWPCDPIELDPDARLFAPPEPLRHLCRDDAAEDDAMLCRVFFQAWADVHQVYAEELGEALYEGRDPECLPDGADHTPETLLTVMDAVWAQTEPDPRGDRRLLAEMIVLMSRMRQCDP